MTLCRAKPELLELGNSLPAARKSIAERKQLRIIALGSSSTSGYGVSNPAYAYPAQLKMGLDKALPGIDIDVVNRGIGGQDVEEMAARMRTEMKENPRVAGGLADRHQCRHPPDAARQVRRLAARRARRSATSLGADFVLMNLQYVPAVVAVAGQGSLREGHGRRRPRTITPACSAASTSCAAGTRTACPTPSSCSSTACISTISARSASASC